MFCQSVDENCDECGAWRAPWHSGTAGSCNNWHGGIENLFLEINIHILPSSSCVVTMVYITVYFHRFPQTISSHLWYPVHPHPHPIIARPLRTTRARVVQPETSKPQGFVSTAIVLTFDWAHYSQLNILSLSDQKSLSLRNLYYHWNRINPS